MPLSSPEQENSNEESSPSDPCRYCMYLGSRGVAHAIHICGWFVPSSPTRLLDAAHPRRFLGRGTFRPTKISTRKSIRETFFFSLEFKHNQRHCQSLTAARSITAQHNSSKW